jgi:hypothetical protein
VYEGDTVDSVSDFMVLRFVASNIPEWLTFTHLRCVKLLNRLVDLNEIVYDDVNIDNDNDSMLFLLVASTIGNWRTLTFLMCVQF